jgi:hypothetical protein
VDELGVPVGADQQVAAEAGAEAEGVDVEAGQVHQVDGVGQADVVGVGPGVEAVPEDLPAPATPLGCEHGNLPRGDPVKVDGGGRGGKRLGQFQTPSRSRSGREGVTTAWAWAKAHW